MSAPAAGFNPFAGTSGDFLAVSLGLTTGLSLVPVPGSPPTPVSLLELSKWELTVRINGVRFVGFGAAVDARRIMWGELLAGGIGEWELSAEGSYNGDSGAGADTWSKITPGSFLYAHLLFDKVSGYGYRGIRLKCKQFSGGADVENTSKPSPARLQFDGTGVLTAPTFAP